MNNRPTESKTRRRAAEEPLWARLAEALRREFPDVVAEPMVGGLRWRFGDGKHRTLKRSDVRSFGSAVERAANSRASYFDEAARVLHLVAPNALVHLRLDERPAKLSPIECCLTAALCDAGEALASKLVAGSNRELCRWLELRLRTTVLEMAASRLKRALAKTGVTDSAGENFAVGVAQERIGGGFRLSGIGPALRFPSPDPDETRAKIERRLPKGTWIEGRSALVLENGDYVDERDFIVGRDHGIDMVREILGPELRKPTSRGPVVLVRPSQRFSVQFLEDRDRPGRLHRLLAAADLFHAEGPLAEVGAKLWRMNTRSK